MWRIYDMVLCFLLLGIMGVEARYVGPTRQGLSFHVSAFPSDIYLADEEITNEKGKDEFPTVSTLTVHVLDVNQKPLSGVPVTFEMAPGCKSIATLTPNRAVTAEGGMAQAKVTSDDTTGLCHLTVQVDNVTQKVRILVLQPEVPSDDGDGDRERERER